MSLASRPATTSLRDALAVAELFLGVFRRDLLAFYPQSSFQTVVGGGGPINLNAGPNFKMHEVDPQTVAFELFGARYKLRGRDGNRFSAHDLRLIQAIGAVSTLRYHNLFQIAHSPRLELYRGGSEDHYVSAFVEPAAYTAPWTRPSRVAQTIQTLRTTALSTYENRRVSSGALLLGSEPDPDRPLPYTPPDALTYGVELTSLKSIHRLCDGKRTLFLVDRDGKLVEIVDIERWASATPDADGQPDVPCARLYEPHARATRTSGHVCLVLSPNQEIKLFSGGMQTFSFSHGRWRVLDPATKFGVWSEAVADPGLARVLFQMALDLAEARQGGLFVVLDRPEEAVGRLIAPHDLLQGESALGPPGDITPGDPLAKRALHYLARGRKVTELDTPILESLSSIDGALVTDRSGQLMAFGAILRHDASPTPLPGLAFVEGARTTAALVASRFGAVLKVSEDGVVSCFLNGTRAWDL